jgi:hypothetical protein
MQITKRATISLILTLLFLCMCIDPYYQKVDKYESLLVVDGLLTDENASYVIRLSRTLADQNGIPDMVTDASVSVTDDLGAIYNFTNSGNGYYRSDSTEFTGQPGRTYVLHITSGDGTTYESDPVQMKGVPAIDSLYFEKDAELYNNGTQTDEGIRIYLNSARGDEDTYYRWTFDETWKFKVPYPVKARYINEYYVPSVPIVNHYCWKNKSSDLINIQPAFSQGDQTVTRKGLHFISSTKSDRLMIQYSILVKQYSISEAEYNFWYNLTRVSLSGSDIFASQPYTVLSNIHNASGGDERILGYFQVASVSKKRLDIGLSEIIPLDLPWYKYPCEKVVTSPSDVVWVGHKPPVTFDDLYVRYTALGYIFVEPLFISGTTNLDQVIFVLDHTCVDCTLTGSSRQPDFWVDRN